MTISITLTETEAEMLSNCAVKKQVSDSKFVYDAAMKAVRNAMYLSKLKESDNQLREGKVKTFTSEEWEKFVNEQEIQ